jgi:hypothetical protein
LEKPLLDQGGGMLPSDHMTTVIVRELEANGYQIVKKAA